MSEEGEEKRRPGVPKYYYWGKSPPKPKSVQTRFVNGAQKKFYVALMAFKLAKIAAIATVFFLILGKL